MPPTIDAGSSVVERGSALGRLRRAGLLGAGSLLLLYYLWGLNYGALIASARQFPAHVALLVVGLNVLPGAIKYLRWRYFLGERGLGPHGRRAYLAVNAGFFLGLVTPGTAGELSRAWIGGETEVGRGTAVVAFEKLMDLLVLLVLVAGSAAVQFTEGLRSWVVVGIALVSVLILYVLFLRFDGILTAPLKLLFGRLVSDRRQESLRDAYWEFYEVVEHRRLVFVSLLASAGLWSVTLVQMHLIFTALGWAVPVKTTALALFLPYLVGLVSLIPLGLGIFEVAMSKVMSVGLVGGAAAGATLGPLFFRFLVTLPLVLGGYACHLALVIGRQAPAR